METKEKYLPASLDSVAEAMDFISDNLKKIHVKSKDQTRALLLAEEFFAQIVTSKSEGDSDDIRVAVFNKRSKKQVIISYKGKQIEEINNAGLGVDLSDSDMSPETEATIRKMIIAGNAESYTIGYKNGINKVSIAVGDDSKKGLKYTLYALILSIAVGIVLRLLLPENATTFLNDNILTTVKTLFLNALKMITGPVIFFSIAASISTFSDMKELGKIAVKIIVFYLFTTFLAIGLALCFSVIFDPGTFGQLKSTATQVTTGGGLDIKSTIIGIIPDNFFKAFVEMNTLQIIVIAVLIGLGAGKLGEKTDKVSSFLNNANELFLKVTGLITKFIPIMVFVSISSLIISIEPDGLKAIIGFLFVIILAMLAMFVIYNLIVMISAKTSPIKYTKSAISAWFNAFALISSNAAISHTMEVCHKKLKISPKIYSFSIPLGATLNMDGTSIGFILYVLFFAKVFGITLDPGQIAMLIFMVIIMSMGTPGVPGSAVIGMSTLFAQFGIPIEALAIYIGLNAIIEPIATANNVYGDITGTYVIAKRNNLIESGKISL